MNTLTRDERMAIASTILEQLGGNRFTVMVGASNFLALDSGLAFRLPTRFARDGINHVQIELTPRDTYRVRFSKVYNNKLSILEIKLHEDVYAEDLRRIFTAETGLDVVIR